MNTSDLYPGAEERPHAPPAALELGNADIADSCAWQPTEVAPGATPLPIYPQPGDTLA